MFLLMIDFFLFFNNSNSRFLGRNSYDQKRVNSHIKKVVDDDCPLGILHHEKFKVKSW